MKHRNLRCISVRVGTGCIGTGSILVPVVLEPVPYWYRFSVPNPTEELGFQELLKGREGCPCSSSARQLVPPTGTMNENSLDCRACRVGSAKRRSLDEHSILGVTFALTRAFQKVGAEPEITH